MITNLQRTAAFSMDRTVDKFRRELARMDANKAKDLAKIEAKYDEKIKTLKESISQVEDAVSAFIGDNEEFKKEVADKRAARLAPKEGVAAPATTPEEEDDLPVSTEPEEPEEPAEEQATEPKEPVHKLDELAGDPCVSTVDTTPQTQAASDDILKQFFN